MAATGEWRQLNANYVLSVIKENSKTRLDNSHTLRAADTPVSMSVGKRQSFHVLTPFIFESYLLKLSLLTAGHTCAMSAVVRSHLVLLGSPHAWGQLLQQRGRANWLDGVAQAGRKMHLQKATSGLKSL